MSLSKPHYKDVPHDLKLTDEEKKVRDGIFNLNTRRFGKVAEFMIASEFDYVVEEGKNDYDLKDPNNGDAIEVKFSTCEYTEDSITQQNCIDVIKMNAVPANRHVAHQSYQNDKSKVFDCNIEQIKAFKFKYLYYGVFFDDQIAVFKMDSDKFKNMMTAQYMVGYLSPKKKIEKLKAIADGKATKERKDCIDKIVGKFDKISKESNKYLIEVQNNFTNKNYLQRFIALQSKYANIPDDCSDDIKLLCDDYLDYVKNLFPKDVQCDSLSVKQHDGNDKAEGQMHIKNTNFDWHLYTSNNFVGWLSYKDLIDILK